MKTTLFNLVVIFSMVLGATGCVAQADDSDVDQDVEQADDEPIGTASSELRPAEDPTCYTIETCGNSPDGCGWTPLVWQRMTYYYEAHC